MLKSYTRKQTHSDSFWKSKLRISASERFISLKSPEWRIWGYLNCSPCRWAIHETMNKWKLTECSGEVFVSAVRSVALFSICIVEVMIFLGQISAATLTIYFFFFPFKKEEQFLAWFLQHGLLDFFFQLEVWFFFSSHPFYFKQWGWALPEDKFHQSGANKWADGF